MNEDFFQLAYALHNFQAYESVKTYADFSLASYKFYDKLLYLYTTKEKRFAFDDIIILALKIARENKVVSVSILKIPLLKAVLRLAFGLVHDKNFEVTEKLYANDEFRYHFLKNNPNLREALRFEKIDAICHYVLQFGERYFRALSIGIGSFIDLNILGDFLLDEGVLCELDGREIADVMQEDLINYLLHTQRRTHLLNLKNDLIRVFSYPLEYFINIKDIKDVFTTITKLINILEFMSFNYKYFVTKEYFLETFIKNEILATKLKSVKNNFKRDFNDLFCSLNLYKGAQTFDGKIYKILSEVISLGLKFDANLLNLIDADRTVILSDVRLTRLRQKINIAARGPNNQLVRSYLTWRFCL